MNLVQSHIAGRGDVVYPVRGASYPEERQQAIAAKVISQGRASVTELAQTYDVTTETVRRDLLSSTGPGTSTGASVVGAHPRSTPGGTQCRNEGGNPGRPQTGDARAAAEFLPQSGATILLDAGTTTARLAALLPTDRELLVVTNSVPIAARVAGLARCPCRCSVGGCAV